MSIKSFFTGFWAKLGAIALFIFGIFAFNRRSRDEGYSAGEAKQRLHNVTEKAKALREESEALKVSADVWNSDDIDEHSVDTSLLDAIGKNRGD